MVLKINKLKSIILFIITFLFFTLGNLISLNIFDFNTNIERKWIVMLIYCIFSFLLIFKISFKVKKNKIFFLFLWELFIIAVFTSKQINGEFVFLEFIMYSLLIPTIFFNSELKKYKETVMFATIASVIPFIYFIGQGNTLGLLYAIAGLSSLNILSVRNAKSKYLFLTILLFSILIYLTESRTSLIAFIIVSSIYIYKELRNTQKTLIGYIKKGLLIFTPIVAVYSTYDYIKTLIFDKYTLSRMDMLSGRSEMWIDTIKYGINRFGNGENYFLNMYGIGDAHNTFIQVLGAYGLISILLFISIYVYIFIKSLSSRKIEYIGFFSLFLLLSLSENLFFVNSRFFIYNVMFFIYLGLLINDKTKIKLN